MKYRVNLTFSVVPHVAHPFVRNEFLPSFIGIFILVMTIKLGILGGCVYGQGRNSRSKSLGKSALGRA